MPPETPSETPSETPTGPAEEGPAPPQPGPSTGLSTGPNTGPSTGLGPQTEPHAADAPITPATLGRLGLGGAMMGLANLVPGISGGTMLVAAGVYQLFIDAVADATRLRLTPRTLAVLGTTAAAAAVAFVAFSGLIVKGLAEARWAMFSLFIGLTLGGVPVMLKLIGRLNTPALIAAAAGAAAMAALALAQNAGAQGGGSNTNPVMLALGGLAGASSMILPGLSGAFVLLVLGLYEPIITAIKDTIDAAKGADLQGITAQLRILVPVGLGVVVGIAGVGNLLKWLLHRFEKPTLGVLLGLLLAAPFGLYPFREGVPPQIGDTFKGAVIETDQDLADAMQDVKDWRQAAFTPNAGHLTGSLALIAAGVAVTLAVGRLGNARPES